MDILVKSNIIVVSNTTKTVYVQMTANISPLLPEFLQVGPFRPRERHRCGYLGADGKEGLQTG